MSELTPAQRRARRTTAVLHTLGGYIAGVVGGQLAINMIDPGSGALVGGGASRMDELVTIGGAAFAASRAIKGGKWANAYLGASMGLAAPALQGVANRITSTVQGFLPGSNGG